MQHKSRLYLKFPEFELSVFETGTQNSLKTQCLITVKNSLNSHHFYNHIPEVKVKRLKKSTPLARE